MAFKISINDDYCVWEYNVTPKNAGELSIDDVIGVIYKVFDLPKEAGKLVSSFEPPLSREDIESFGFEIITEAIQIYEQANFRLYKTKGYGEGHYSIQKFDDNQNVFDVFSGTIKNKSELEMVLKMIGI